MPKIKGLNKAGRIGATDSKFTGEEPEWKDAELISVGEFNNRMNRGLRFYSYYCDNLFFKTNIVQWMKDNGYDKEQVLTMSGASLSSIPSTAGKLIRMMNLGMPDRHHSDLNRKKATEYIHEYIIDSLKVMSLYTPLTKVATEKPKLSASQKLNKNLDENVFPILEQIIDEVALIKPDTKTKDIPYVNMIDLLKGAGISPRGTKSVLSWISRNHTEFWETLEKRDEELVEGYNYLTKPQLRRIVQNFGKMLEDVETYSRVTKNPRKPRKKKVIPAEKQVAKMKHIEVCPDSGLKGEKAENIVGAKRVYLFNTKTRKLTVLDAETPAGLKVKGTTVIDFNPGTSYILTLRKPKNTIPEIQEKTLLQIEKVINGLKTKRNPAKGRTNDHTIIIRTISI